MVLRCNVRNGAPLYDTLCARPVRRHRGHQARCRRYDIVAPGKRSCPYHYHLAQEEMFVVLEGAGSLRVAGEMLPVRAGDVIFIPPGPEYPHQLVNTSDAPLKYLSISTQEQPGALRLPRFRQDRGLRQGPSADAARAANLDYWDGEP